MTESPNTHTPLVAFLRDHPIDHPSFPQPDVDYHRRFQNLDAHLNTTVHPTVNQGAAVAAAARDGWLTDHGIQHITTVIRRASDLLFNDGIPVLTPYETFLLLAAIHFHDIGNVFGRHQHERQITTAMRSMSDALIGTDGFEKRMIRDIAMAHGGYADADGHDKDTISHLSWQPVTGLHDPRVRLLAAVLRFADELADDHTRTSRFLIGSQLLRNSEVYHVYADRLQHVIVRPPERSVLLQFEIHVQHATRLYQKGADQKVYLYDEILRRCLKMHREHIYCSRFMQPYVSINRIDVTIDITTLDYMHVVRRITFSLIQRGYPDKPITLAEAAPGAEPLTGAELCDMISESANV